MNKEKSLWRSFQGCVIAAGPLVVAILTGIAAYWFIAWEGLPQLLAVLLAFIIAVHVFILLALLKKEFGNHEQ